MERKHRYHLPSAETNVRHISLLGIEGKNIAREWIKQLILSGILVSISGDLWSEGGIGLFGIKGHGIDEGFELKTHLLALICCTEERHTADNIAKWTTEALKDMGLDAATMLKTNNGSFRLTADKKFSFHLRRM